MFKFSFYKNAANITEVKTFCCGRWGRWFFPNEVSEFECFLFQAFRNISKEINQIQGETKSLASAFNQVKPWSAMLQDISDRYPAGVRLGTISQDKTRRRKKGEKEKEKERFQIFGIANSFDDVNDFLLLLQDSPFFSPEDTLILKAKFIEDIKDSDYYKLSRGVSQDILDDLPDFVEYRIGVTLSGVPTSELVQALERKGTVGLVSRIKVLQKEGIIKQ